MASNPSFVSPLADAQYPVRTDILGSFIGGTVDNLNGWTVALTIFLGLVLYDQCLLLLVNVFWTTS